MTRRVVPVLLLLLFGPAAAFSADDPPAAPPPAPRGPFSYGPLPADAPRPSPDPHNLRGYYLMKSVGILLPGVDTKNPPFKSPALELFQKRQAAIKVGNTLDDPQVQCRPMNAVRLFGSGFPQIQFLQVPDEIVMLLMEDHIVRRIALNRGHPAQVTPTTHGDSVGHWEGDTLVVDTIGFKDGSWMDESGTPGDHNEHMIERIRKIDGGQKLEDEVTIEDSTTFIHPISFKVDFSWRPDAVWDEVICEEGNRDASDSSGMTSQG